MHRTDTTDRTSSGVVKTGGITTLGSPIITGLTVATDINVGDWVTMDKGFDTQRFKVSATAAAQITVEGLATSNETGVTVTVVADMYTIGDGISINRTIYGPDQANALQEELINAIEASGLGLDKDDNRQLQNALVKRNGDTMFGNYNITGDLIASSLGLHKTVAGTGADATADIIEEGGGKFTINALAVNSNKTLFEFGSAFDEKEFYLDVVMLYKFAGASRQAHFRGLIKTGAAPSGIWGVAPQWSVWIADSDTVTHLGGFYINDDTANDADFDGTGNKNGVPLILIRTSKIDIRNTDDAGALSEIRVRIKTSGLL